MGPDDRLFLAVNEALSGPLSTFLFTWVTRLGDGLVLAALILPTMFFLDRRRFRAHALPLVLAVAISGGLVTVIKVAVDRPRPPERFAAVGIEVHAPLGSPPDRSFPSGHTQTAFGAATYLAFLYPLAAPAFLLGAALVGLSRVALGVHFPLDVLVGAVFGVAFSAVAHAVARRRARARAAGGGG